MNHDEKDMWADHNEDYHNKIANTYEEAIRPHSLPQFIFYYKNHLKFLNKLNKRIKILDIGAGTGDFCKDLLSMGFTDITANDIADKMLKQIKREYPTVKTNLGDATKLMFDDETFDFINMKGCLHHIKGTEKVIKEVYRCLKHDGLFRLQEPNTTINSKIMDHSEDIFERPLNYRDIVTLLEKNGLKIVKSRLFLHFQTNDILDKYTTNENIKNMFVSLFNPICNLLGRGDIFLIISRK